MAVTIHWTGPMDWTTGLDHWTGILNWTTGPEYWTGLLDVFQTFTIFELLEMFQTKIILIEIL